MADVDGGVLGQECRNVKGEGRRGVTPFPKHGGGIGSEGSDGAASVANNGDCVVAAGDIRNPVIKIQEGEIKGGMVMENVGEAVVCLSKCRPLQLSVQLE